MGLAGDRVRLAEEGGELTLPLEQINKAKLLLTDALIKATAAGPKRN